MMLELFFYLLGRRGWLLQGVGMLVLRHRLQANYLPFSIHCSKSCPAPRGILWA